MIRPLHAGEPPIHISLAERLVADQFPEYRGLPVKEIESQGTSNVIFRLGTDLSIRLPRTGGAATHLKKEYDWLPRIEPHLPVQVPTPLNIGEPGAGFPWHWTICKWLEGSPPLPGDNQGS